MAISCQRELIFMGRIFKIIGIYILSLAIIALLYYLFGLIPGYMDTQDLNKSVKVSLESICTAWLCLVYFPCGWLCNRFRKVCKFYRLFDYVYIDFVASHCVDANGTCRGRSLNNNAFGVDLHKHHLP